MHRAEITDLDPHATRRSSTSSEGVAGARGPVAACTTPVREGMVVDTHDETAQRVARGVVELVLSDYPAGALAEPVAAADDRNELLVTLDFNKVYWSMFTETTTPYQEMSVEALTGSSVTIKVGSDVGAPGFNAAQRILGMRG